MDEDNFVAGVIRALTEPDALTSLLQTAEAIRTFNHDSDLLKGMLREKEYARLQCALKTEVKNVNAEVDFDVMVMTGLEFSIYHGDWRMASIFFANGADPSENCFDGVIQTHGSYYGMEDPIFVEGFESGSKMPGFDGLRALIDEEDELRAKLNAHLSLMELCSSKDHQDKLNTSDFSGILSSLQLVCDDGYESHFLRIKESLRVAALICQRHNLNRESTASILKTLLVSSIWSFFTEDVVNDVVAL